MDVPGQPINPPQISFNQVCTYKHPNIQSQCGDAKTKHFNTFRLTFFLHELFLRQHNSICKPQPKPSDKSKNSSQATTTFQAARMPQSRELANKKNDHKDRQSRGRAGSTPTDMKKGGAGAHNWGITTENELKMTAIDRQDPNYDSSGEADE